MARDLGWKNSGIRLHGNTEEPASLEKKSTTKDRKNRHLSITGKLKRRPKPVRGVSQNRIAASEASTIPSF